MKNVIVVFSGFICFFIFCSSSAFRSIDMHGLTHEDSMRIYNVVRTHPDRNFTKNSNRAIFKTRGAYSLIDSNKARQLHKSYLDKPLDLYTDASKTQLVRGYRISREDLVSVYNAGDQGARIYMGYDSIDSKYKLMLLGIDATGINDLAAVADDFIPCPNECPDGGGFQPAMGWRIFHSDLNYLATEGNEVIMKGFNGTTYRRTFK